MLNTYWVEDRKPLRFTELVRRTRSIASGTCCRPASPTTARRAIAACSTAGSVWRITSSRTSVRPGAHVHGASGARARDGGVVPDHRRAGVPSISRATS